MRKILIALASMCLVAQTPAEQVEKAERAFAAMAGKDGTKRAFLHFLADKSWVLRPQVADARKVYEASKEDGSLLSWWPQWIGVADSGDLAFSTGPFEFRPTRDAKPLVTGHFLSIWRKQKDGSWRVEVDGGIPHAAPEANSGAEAVASSTREWGSLRRDLATGAEGTAPAKPDPGASLNSLAAEEARMGEEAAQIGWRCLANHLAPEGVLYRRGLAPIEAKKDQTVALEQDGTGAGTTVEASGVSQDGSLGYTVGTAKLKAGDGTPASSRSYFRIWQSLPKQGWRVLYDVQLPLPEEKKP